MRPARWSLSFVLVLCLTSYSKAGQQDPPAAPIRAGIIGLDTSHATAFAKIFADPNAKGDIPAVKIVAAFPGGSPDLPASRDRVPEYTKVLREMGVEIVDSIPALLEKVDVVLLESVDGRPHLEQARPVFEAGKPLFIDKPLAGSLADGVAIAELGKKHNVPWFSSSSLRYAPGIAAAGAGDEKIGDILGCVAWSPAPIESTHPDLFWYGIHGVETLYTIMGPGCQTVTRTHTAGADVVTGVWKDGRVGTFRGTRQGAHDYGAIAFGTKSVAPTGGYAGYEVLVEQIATFFKTRKPPIEPEETLEILAFMEAADESKRQNGATVKLEDVMAKARAAAEAKLQK